MCRGVANSERELHFAKADREADYKQLSLAWEQSSLAAIALRSPEDGRRYGFTSRTLMLGDIAAVLRRIVFPRILSELMCRTIDIPMISYFDDFGALLPASLSKSGLYVCTRRCSFLGIQLEEAKSDFGPQITFLGLLGNSPSARKGDHLSPSQFPLPGKG